jgi:uncharacterized repeat protein (TIGR01451 family)
MYSFFQQMQALKQSTYKRWKQNLSKASSAVIRRTSLMGGLSLFLGTLCLSAQPSHAEGSISLTPVGSTGLRPFLLYNNGVSSGINLKTVIKVYANSGETINLGSSANGVGTGVINYRSPSGVAGSCSTAVGKITTRAQEVAGPLPNVGGYTPCLITAVQTTAAGSGIWEIDFVSPSVGGATSPAPILATANWPAQANGQVYVTAWDVTVRNAIGVTQLGRAYTNYLAATIATNQNNAFNSLLYVLTQDGYQYSINTNGLDPNQFVFFSNNKGFKNTATNNPTYLSYDFVGANPGNPPAGISFQNPGAADTATDFTNKIFFNSIDASLPSFASSSSGSTWLFASPTPPPVPSGFIFKGIQGTTAQAGVALGGNFTFNVPSSGPYQIVLDLNNNGILGDGNDRVLAGTAVVGANTVFWDGKDGLGAVVPASNIPINASVSLFSGEVHFPLLDAESNLGGMIIQRLNSPVPSTTPAPNPFWVYYDDTGVKGNGGLGGGSAIAPNPLKALLGVNSSAGAHKWGNSAAAGFGNITGIDTWSYYPSNAVSLAQGILIQAADMRITKNHSPSTVVAGGLVTYTIDVTNFNNPPTSVSNIKGAIVTDVLPSQLSGATLVSCSVITGTGNCVSSTFTGNTLNGTVDLDSGATARYVITATLAAGSTGTLTNTATVTRDADIADPIDQDGSGGTNTSESAIDNASIGAGADVVTTKTGPATATPGSTVTYTLSTVNNGPTAAANVVITDNIGTGLTGVVASNGGTYNSVTGIVTFPTIASLANGTTQANTISVTAPASGNLTDIVSSTSSTGDPNPANNDGSASAAKVTTSITSTSASAELLLVKRITAVNGDRIKNPNDNTALDVFVNDTTANNQNTNWPNPASGTPPISTFLRGVIDAGKIKPGDTLEYTIYFLNAGIGDASNVKICDRLTGAQTFLNGIYGAKDLQLHEGNGAFTTLSSVATVNLTGVSDSGDRAQFLASSSSAPASCNLQPVAPGTADNGTLMVDITGTGNANQPDWSTVKGSTGAGTTNAYGFVRFSTRIIP